MKTRFGDEEFLDGVDMSHREFFEKLIETEELPKTSQISPYEYAVKLRDEGKTLSEIVDILNEEKKKIRVIAYTGLSDSLLQKYIKDSEFLYKDMASDFPISTIGSTIGTYVCPGAIGAAFYAKE